MSEQGAARYNSDKVKLTFNLPLLEKLEALVSTFGAIKYASWNWLRGGKASTPVDCMKRHLAALQAGEWLDPDSGLPHAAHIRWNAGQIIQWKYSDVLEWDLPVCSYNSQLDSDLLVAAEKVKAAKAQYEEARKKAGLE